MLEPTCCISRAAGFLWAQTSQACRRAGREGFLADRRARSLSAHLVSTRPEICAHHFCRYGDSERVDARRAVQSIAFQLASCLPDYAQRLNALDLDCLAVADPRGAFNALVEAPLGSDFPEPLWLPILS